MRTAMTVVVSAALTLGFNGRAEANKLCIAKATEQLPRIPGLVVKKSRVLPVPAAILASWKGQSRPIMIELDVEIPSEAQIYSYICVITQGSAFVQRTMN
jgi:hypothetical protein